MWPVKIIMLIQFIESSYKNIVVPTFRFLVPITYLLLWILVLKLAELLLGESILQKDLFLWITLIILFIGLIARSNLFSIGGEKGFRIERFGRFLNFHKGENGEKSYWFDAYSDDPENIKTLKELITKLTKIK